MEDQCGSSLPVVLVPIPSKSKWKALIPSLPKVVQESPWLFIPTNENSREIVSLTSSTRYASVASWRAAMALLPNLKMALKSLAISLTNL
ncbi:hypothetical protein GOBAR_DD27117 [Gossypium barbadense]|nr:hypothetical protein GOBAR_DD27117 [Gossypium barbadense]